MREYVNEAYDRTVEMLRAQAERTVQSEGAFRTAAYLAELKRKAAIAKREKALEGVQWETAEF